MNDFNPVSLYAIAEEFLGIWLYAGLAAAVVVIALWVLALYRGTPLGGSPLRYAALIGLVAGIAAMILAPPLTQAGYRQLLAVIDFVMLALIGIGVFVGALIAFVPVFALMGYGRRVHRPIALTTPR
ncbi:MAG TPA: DUF5368 family protein, partial [Saliniramus sp.]|nr:DUF5368 family protein [Saliniramus sp.]